MSEGSPRFYTSTASLQEMAASGKLPPEDQAAVEAEIQQRLLEDSNWIPLSLPLSAVLSAFGDGDEHGWQKEFNLLWSEHQDLMDQLTDSIRVNGIQKPIMIGDDRRIWDGHHRLAAAHRLAFQYVPVLVHEKSLVAALTLTEQKLDAAFAAGVDAAYQWVRSSSEWLSDFDLSAYDDFDGYYVTDQHVFIRRPKRRPHA